MKYYFLVFVMLMISLACQSTYAYETIPVPTPTPIFIQYDLAFPGILPDSPLYKLKVLRDKIQIIMATEPKKRTQLFLQQADKGMLAAAILVDKHNIVLAKQTALKAEHNMTLLTHELSLMEDEITGELLAKLKTASLKHQEVLTSLLLRVPVGDQETFQQVIDFSKRNLEEIEKYSQQPS